MFPASRASKKGVGSTPITSPIAVPVEPSRIVIFCSSEPLKMNSKLSILIPSAIPIMSPCSNDTIMRAR